jgi:hypothetical protein
MRTAFSQINAEFSTVAHELAVKKVYPALFGISADRLAFDDDTLFEKGTRGQILDGAMGIDYVARVAVMSLGAPLQLTVQERFRRAQYANFRDVTITEWNLSSGLPSELYKITSGIFLYGYVNNEGDDFIEAIAFNVTDFLLALTKGRLKSSPQYNPRSDQNFLCYTFDQLEAANLVRFHYTPTGGHRL